MGLTQPKTLDHRVNNTAVTNETARRWFCVLRSLVRKGRMNRSRQTQPQGPPLGLTRYP